MGAGGGGESAASCFPRHTELARLCSLTHVRYKESDEDAVQESCMAMCLLVGHVTFPRGNVALCEADLLGERGGEGWAESGATTAQRLRGRQQDR